MNAPLISAPGFYPDITPEQYFAEPCPAPALTNSGIGTLLRTCPAKFAHEHVAIAASPEVAAAEIARYKGMEEQPDLEDEGEAKAVSPAQRMGSLVHRLALGKGADYVVSPHKDYRKTEAKEWKAEVEASGKIPVKAKEMRAAERMAVVLRERIAEQTKGHLYETEVVVSALVDGVWCRIMVDVWCQALMLAIDIKTCASADDLAVDRAFSGGYARQDAWYTFVLGRALKAPGRVRFAFLFVEKEKPHLSRLADSTEAMRTGSNMECERGLAIFRACQSANEWPGYPPRRVQPTAWQVRDWADAELEEAA